MIINRIAGVLSNHLVNIYIKQVGKTVYNEEEYFDASGYIIMALYSNGQAVDISSQCTYDLTGKLYYNNTKVIFSYTEGNVTKTCEQKITINIDFIPLEYIESTGVQYINTGVVPAANISVELETMFTSETQAQYAGLFGAQIDDNNTFGYTFTNTPGSGIGLRTGDGEYMRGPVFTANTRYTINGRLNVLTINGTTISGTGSFGTTMDEPMYIFARNSNNVVLTSTFTKARLYYFKIYQNDVLIRDFVPAIDKETHSIGLYDKKNKIFYENKGAESFAAPVVLPEGYKALNYIHGTGTQWIDTEVFGSAKGTYEIRFNTITATKPAFDHYFGGGDKNSTTPKIYHQGNGTSTSVHIQGLGINGSTTSYTGTAFTASNDTIHTIQVTNNAILTDGAQIYTYTPRAWGDYSFYIFNNHIENTAIATMKLYYVKMWSDGVLIRYFFPAKREEDNEIGLFDIVENKFYINKGTGSFLSGGEI